MLVSLSLTPEQRRLRAASGGNARAGHLSPEQLKEISAKGQGGLRERFVRQAAEQWPDLSEEEIDRRAGHLLKSHKPGVQGVVIHRVRQMGDLIPTVGGRVFQDTSEWGLEGGNG